MLPDYFFSYDYGRTVNNKINKLYERALRIVHKDSNFPRLLDMDNSVTVYHGET